MGEELITAVIAAELNLLVFLQGFVYWSDAVTRSICRASKHNSVHLQVLQTNVTSPGGVVIVHPVLQPEGMTNHM